MEGKLPEIYWFLFWVGVVVAMTGLFVWGGIVGHRQRMKALEILKMYAEKGMEPPASIMEPLARQIFDPQKAETKQAANRQAVYLGKFVGGVSAAAVCGGISWWWREEMLEPTWVVYAAGIMAIAIAAGAISQLVAAIVTREK